MNKSNRAMTMVPGASLLSLPLSSLALLSLAVLFFPGMASAHHSFAMFNQDSEVTIQGTVKALTWSNPHVWLDVTVAGSNGATLNWGLESQSVAILHRRGWKPDSIKAGDAVTVVLHPMKDGTPGGQLLRVTFADGHVLTAAGRASELN